MNGPGPDAEQIAAAAIASLPAITPARTRRLLGAFGGPVGALDAVRAGRAAPAIATTRDDGRGLARAWAAAADPEGVARILARRGTRVWIDGRPGHPVRRAVPDPPPVLLGEGDDPGVLDRPRVAIVGTRAATPHGLADARQLGGYLAEAGVTVVSGLAIGIDGAAHEGAVAAGGPVVGVVATGLDVVYPRRHRGLFEQVRRHGLLVGEVGYGVPPEPGRFPVRNRIIAAASDVVVVVEATARGGARITAEFALRYQRSVLAVPGSRRNPAAEGCNALIADGAHPLLEPSDVLLALGLAAGEGGWQAPPVAVPGPAGRAVLRALGGEPATLDELASRTGLPDGEVAAACRELERARRVERSRGLYWPR